MESIKKNIQELNDSVVTDAKSLNISKLSDELESLLVKQSEPDFWQDQSNATIVNKKISSLESQINPWKKLLDDLSFLVDLSEEADESMLSDLSEGYESAQSRYELLKKDLLFKGPYDNLS